MSSQILEQNKFIFCSSSSKLVLGQFVLGRGILPMSSKASE